MSKKVLLTGASGFFGSHLLRHLLMNTDYDIVCPCSWTHKGTPERILSALDDNDIAREDQYLPRFKDRVTIITHDLTAPFTETTKKVIGKADIILNIASNSHVDRSITNPGEFVIGNTMLAYNLLEYAREVKPELFLQFSTDEVYGVAPEGVNHKEWSAIVPSNPYSASKACQEAIAISYWRTFGVPVILTNTMNLFGQTQDAEKYVARLIRKIHTGEKVTIHGRPDKIGSRFYLHARNAADAVLFIVKNVKPPLYVEDVNLLPERFNIVGDVELNNLELAQMVADIMGKELNYELDDFHHNRPGHDRRYSLDGAKLKALGWNAPHEFRESLKSTIDWTLQHSLWL